jgi:predicted house-cleaning NTP pyrophosphatase (Maf/HAM1 superfamily)
MILILLNIVVIIACVFVYTTINLLRKNEQLEDAVTSQQQYVDKLDETITYCSNRIKEIDERGTFSSDDEIGWFFQEIKDMSIMIEKFKTTK